MSKHLKEISQIHGDWKGYSLDQLQHRRAINSVKSDLIKEQMVLAYGNAMSTLGNGSGMINEQFSKVMTYTSYGIQLFKQVKSLYSMLRGIK